MASAWRGADKNITMKKIWSAFQNVRIHAGTTYIALSKSCDCLCCIRNLLFIPVSYNGHIELAEVRKTNIRNWWKLIICLKILATRGTHLPILAHMQKTNLHILHSIVMLHTVCAVKQIKIFSFLIVFFFFFFGSALNTGGHHKTQYLSTI